MDDATATDNCGEVKRPEVSSETTLLVLALVSTRSRARSRRPTTAATAAAATQTITVQDTTAPELTSIPADYLRSALTSLILDDATASDNCGEVTIEVTSETTAGSCAGEYDHAYVHCD